MSFDKISFPIVAMKMEKWKDAEVISTLLKNNDVIHLFVNEYQDNSELRFRNIEEMSDGIAIMKDVFKKLSSAVNNIYIK